MVADGKFSVNEPREERQKEQRCAHVIKKLEVRRSRSYATIEQLKEDI